MKCVSVFESDCVYGFLLQFQKTCSCSAIHVVAGMKPEIGAKTKDTN